MKSRRHSDTSLPLVPERIGRYEVLLPIASGGMATVYLGRTHGVGGFEREVALKVMHAHLREDETFAQDIVEEAKLAVRIQHPNVVRVHDVGEDPHGVYLVMDYVEGDSFAGLQRTVSKRNEAFPASIGLRILVDALLGLHAAHELRKKDGSLVGVVHRDFSPQNILVGMDGISQLTDFGVAKASTRMSHTATGLVKGKVHYMSPEQAKTEELDRRCDIWAAGVIAWELLAQRRLYRERNEATILLQLISEPPPRLRTVAPDMPAALDDAVASALTTDVTHRCASAEELAQALSDGAERLAGLATHAEVSEFVRRLAGDNLTTRREQASRMLKLRASISTIAAEAATDSEITTPSNFGVNRPANEEPSDEALTVATAPNSMGQEAIAPAETEQTSTSQALPIPPMSRRNRWPLVGGAVAVIAVAGLAFTAANQGSSEGAPGAPAETMAPTGEPPPSPEPTASAKPALTPVNVTIVANAEVSDLVIGERAVTVDPSTKFEVEIRGPERASEQRLRAISVDGRRTEVTWKPGTLQLELDFETKPKAAPPVPVRPRPPRPAPTPKPKAGPLAPNPFDN